MKRINNADDNGFRIVGGEVDLQDLPTKVDSLYTSGDDYKEKLAAHVDDLSSIQQLLYASNKYAVLIVFQAMDTGGKDGMIRHVFSGINPQGCQVTSFKQPSAIESSHDFLWRTARNLPERGHIGVFNRSYYEDVLIARVHPDLLQAGGAQFGDIKPKKLWRQRYQSINDWERHLTRNGTRILKFFLHISKDEQRQRFLSRIDNAKKNWKFSTDDIKERAYWDKYTKAYEKCLSATGTQNAPWFVIPADDKKNARLMVAKIILDELSTLDMQYPQSDANRKAELQVFRDQLTAAS